MAEFHPYPARRYHATEPSRVVQSEAEEAALGPEWVDDPSKAADQPAAPRGLFKKRKTAEPAE